MIDERKTVITVRKKKVYNLKLKELNKKAGSEYISEQITRIKQYPNI